MSNLNADSARFLDSYWYSALGLRERAELIGDAAQLTTVTSSVAERRFRRWLSTPAFEIKSNLIHFLQHHQLSEIDFLALLAESPDSLKSRCLITPDWLEEILVNLNRRDMNYHSPLLDTDSLGFLHLVDPLIAKYINELIFIIRDLNRQFPNAIIETTLVNSLSDGLLEQILTIVTKTLVLEVNIARIEQILEGSNSEERYESFRKLLKTPSYRNAIFAQYPVLARHCLRICRQWLTSSKEFLGRTCHDRVLLAKTLGYSAVGALVSADITMSDSHHQGRRVIIASFDSDLQVVYKPRSLAVAERLQSFIDWLNACGHDPQIRRITILNRGSYGWAEYVEHRSCTSALDVERFYRRQGALLAILYCLAGTDCHFQNIIASGADPVLVDIETLFQPRLAEADTSTTPGRIAQRILADSVLSVGLLPTPVLVHDNVVDLSGLGASPFQVTQLETTGLERGGTDEVRVARVAYRIDETQNRAILDGSVVDVHDHAANLEAGFSFTYDLLRENRSELLAPGGPLSLFRDAPIRVLLRPTAAYSALLEESFHPKVLRDGVERERVLGQLWWATASQPILKRVVFSEYKQMLDGDVPYFSSTPDSVDLTSSDEELVYSVFSVSGLSIAEERIHRMSDSDLDQHRWLIRASVLCLGEEPRPSIRTQRSIESGSTFVDVSAAIGERLEALAIRSSDGDSWLSLNAMSSTAASHRNHYSVGVVGSDLYDGLAGISLYLAYLASATSHKPFQHLAEGALKMLETRLPELKTSQSIGAFDGLGGLVYLYTHIGTLWSDDTLFAKATDLLTDVAIRITDDRSLDVIGGSAGCIPCLLSLHNQCPNTRSLELAVSCGDHIVAALRTTFKGLSGQSNRLRYERGFSHGYSGIAWALSELGVIASESRFLNASLDILALERSLLSGGRWTDPEDQHLSGQASWCHGAPGIALGRLAMSRRMDDTKIREDAESALERTAQSFDLDNHGLCHGGLGNLEALLVASETFSESPRWSMLAEKRGRLILDDIAKHGWRSASPSHIDIPGLMTGIAGIGFEFLRLANPSKIPNILLLEVPKSVVN